jgi:hypothetical protein
MNTVITQAVLILVDFLVKSDIRSLSGRWLVVYAGFDCFGGR